MGGAERQGGIVCWNVFYMGTSKDPSCNREVENMKKIPIQHVSHRLSYKRPIYLYLIFKISEAKLL